MSVSPACWPCKLCWNWGLSSAPVKYEAGSNRESIQWMFTVRLEGRGESENRGGSISSCCLPPALLTPKNAARKPNFPFLNLRSCWRCSVRQYAGKGTGWIVTALLGNQHTLKQRHYDWSRGGGGRKTRVKKTLFCCLGCDLTGWTESLPATAQTCRGREKSGTAQTMQPASFTGTGANSDSASALSPVT